MIYLRHDNPQHMLGEGYALALEAGAVFRDMEFFQFCPISTAESGRPQFIVPSTIASRGRWSQTALLILQAALRREESRGAQFREDFPVEDDRCWRGHLEVALSGGGPRLVVQTGAACDGRCRIKMAWAGRSTGNNC